MALHINEVTIQMRVRQDGEAGAVRANGLDGDHDGATLTPEQVEAIVGLAVRRAVAAIKSGRER